MFKNALILVCSAVVTVSLGCGSSGTSNTASVPNSATNSNVNSAVGREIKLDPANMPPGLSAKPIQMSANMPPGISVNAAPPSGKTTPGIPSDADLKKGFKPGKFPTPGIPDQQTIRKQLGTPTNAPPANNVPMMKGNRKLGGKP